MGVTAMTETPVRVLVADDQALFRSGLTRLLGDDTRVCVVGTASNGQEAVDGATRLAPQVVLMDLRMPGVDGLEATRRILAANPSIRVLVLTGFDSDSYVSEALRSGASGYVLKDSEIGSLVSAIVAVATGDQVLIGRVARAVLDMANSRRNPKEYYDGLTARELQVLHLIAAGSANKQIAFQLRISEKTVRNHVSNMYEKLGIFDRSQAVLYAVRKGMVDL
jgi:DNA-binding NarL/FixJ family response regulator